MATAKERRLVGAHGKPSLSTVTVATDRSYFSHRTFEKISSKKKMKYQNRNQLVFITQN